MCHRSESLVLVFSHRKFAAVGPSACEIAGTPFAMALDDA